MFSKCFCIDSIACLPEISIILPFLLNYSFARYKIIGPLFSTDFWPRFFLVNNITCEIFCQHDIYSAATEWSFTEQHCNLLEFCLYDVTDFSYYVSKCVCVFSFMYLSWSSLLPYIWSFQSFPALTFRIFLVIIFSNVSFFLGLSLYDFVTFVSIFHVLIFKYFFSIYCFLILPRRCLDLIF